MPGNDLFLGQIAGCCRGHAIFAHKISEKKMPLLSTLRPAGACVVFLWEIDEDEPALRAGLWLTPEEDADLAGITHPAQRVEWLACRSAMRQLSESQGFTYHGMVKDEYGKPHLIGLPGHISLSHTSGWAAAVWHPDKPVGLDIEPLRAQFSRVVPRVLSEAEIRHAGGSLHRLAMYWCAKESLYKLYGKRQLTFREHLHIEPFADDDTQLTGHVRLPDHFEAPPEGPVQIFCFRTGPGLLAVAF